MDRLFLLIIVVSSLFLACDNNISPTPTEEEEAEHIKDFQKVFSQKWALLMDANKSIASHANGVVYKDWYVKTGDLDFPARLLAFNKNTISKDWDYKYEGTDNSNIDITLLYKHLLVCITAFRIFTFDLNNQEVVWELNLKELNIRPSKGTITENNLFYLKADFDFKRSDHTQYLMEFNINTGDYRIVYTAKANEYSIGISPPVYYNNGKQELLIFNEYPKFSEVPEKTTQNIVAIDLHSTEVVWRTENFTEAFQSNTLHPPIVYNNTVITGGDWSIYAFNADNGEQLWRYAFNYPWAIWANTNHLIYKDRLYVNNGQHDVTCINLSSGRPLWNNPRGGANCTDNMVYYEKEDLLVFTSWGYGSVMILDAKNGETLHREHRYEHSSYNNDVVYDAETDMFFTSTYKHVIGFKVNRP